MPTLDFSQTISQTLGAGFNSYTSFQVGGTRNAYFTAVPEDIKVNVAAASDVPEPATLALFGLGLVGVASVRRKRTQRGGRNAN